MIAQTPKHTSAFRHICDGTMSAHREDILECWLQEVPQLLLCDKFEECWLQWVIS